MSTRCRNCGYDNPAGNSTCNKCNQLLTTGGPSYTERENFSPRETLRETSMFAGGGSQVPPVNPSTCPQCGYPLMSGATNCPQCRQSTPENPAKPKEDVPFGRRTVRPDKRHRCELTLIPEERERIKPTVMSFSGEEIVLNRDNTEPDNMTITSKEQAALIYENKRWYIEDRSELKTTYVRVNDRIELQPGDVIMLGDRCFEFDF